MSIFFSHPHAKLACVPWGPSLWSWEALRTHLEPHFTHWIALATSWPLRPIHICELATHFHSRPCDLCDLCDLAVVTILPLTKLRVHLLDLRNPLIPATLRPTKGNLFLGSGNYNLYLILGFIIHVVSLIVGLLIWHSKWHWSWVHLDLLLRRWDGTHSSKIFL